MLRPCMTEIASKNESYYSVVMGVARRARAIADELYEKGMVLEEKPVKTAVDELAARKYSIIEDPALRKAQAKTE